MAEIKVEAHKVAPLATNCYLIRNADTNKLVIVDPGNCNDRIFNRVKELESEPVAILLTHGHFDHIMGIKGWLQAYPGIPVYSGVHEIPMLQDPGLNMTRRFREYAVSVTPDVTLEDGETFEMLGCPVTFLHTPGHTPGGGCYYWPEQGWLFSGDTLFKGCMGRYDFEGGNYDDLMESLKRLAQLPEETLVYPGHEASSQIGWELIHNPYLNK